MTYHLKPNRKKKTVPLFVSGGILVLVVFIHLAFPTFFITGIAKLGIPVLHGQGIVGDIFASIGDDLASKQKLADHNRDLQYQIDVLNAEHEQNAVLRLENDELKRLLGRIGTSTQHVLATVLARPPQTPYDTVILDAGTAQGIAVDDQILAYNLVPIGKIAEVYTGFSKAVLYSSSGQSVNVSVGTSTHATAEALGGGSFKIKVPREAPIAAGDPVMIPSIRAQVFGTVEKIDQPEGDAFKYVFFQSPVNIQSLRFVEVVPALKIN